MGQKVSPTGWRIGYTHRWSSTWYTATRAECVRFLQQDIKIRKALHGYFKRQKIMIAHFNIDRTARVLIINIETAMVAAVFGQRAKNIPVLEVLVQKAIADRRQRVIINVIAIKNSNLNATLVAKRIAMRLENRESFRIVQKKVMSDALKAGALGVKTSVAGRLGGVDMARREGYKKGLIPLGTLRAVIDYAMVEANTTYGKIGVKVWIYLARNLMAKKNQNQNRTFVTKQKYLRNAAKYEVNRRGGGRNRPLRSRGHFVSRHQNLGASAPQSVPVPTAPPSQEQ